MRNKEQETRKRHRITTGFFCLTRRNLRKMVYILFSLFCFSFVLTSCKKENNVRKLQDTKGTETSGSSVSEEEAMSMAKDLESLEQKEQESLERSLPMGRRKGRKNHIPMRIIPMTRRKTGER